MAQLASKSHTRLLWVLIPLFVILLTLLLWAADRQMRAGYQESSVDVEAVDASVAPSQAITLTDEERADVEASLRPQESVQLTDEERAQIEQSLRN